MFALTVLVRSNPYFHNSISLPRMESPLTPSLSPRGLCHLEEEGENPKFSFLFDDDPVIEKIYENNDQYRDDEKANNNSKATVAANLQLVEP